MQKQVSKQSLAIVALSILIAISMALTATFAAFTASNTVSGTLTFTNGDLTITVAGTSMQSASNGVQVTVSSNTLSVAFTDDAFEYDADEDAFVLTSDAKGILDNYTVTISSNIARTYYYSVVLTSSDISSADDIFDTSWQTNSVEPSNGQIASTVFYLGGDSGNRLINYIKIGSDVADLDEAGFQVEINAAYWDINY